MQHSLFSHVLSYLIDAILCTVLRQVMRAIMKKLKQIDELVKRQAAGDQLDEQQLKKIASLDAVLLQMDEYTKEQGGEVIE